MIIFIPTRGRINYQYTRKYWFLDSIQKDIRTIYIVPECEQNLWLNEGVEIATVPDRFGISEIRQYIIDNWYKVDKFHICLDDDLFRTLKSMNKSSEDLCKLHSKVVRLHEKKYKKSYSGSTRLETFCYWKKAFCSKENERKLYK